jgi:hypothetical protein
MVSILLVSGLYAVALSMLVRRWNRGLGSGQFALATLPICLLFIAAPVPFSVGALIGAFRHVAETGSGGLAAVGPFCVAILNGLRLGTLACLTALSTAAAVQAFAPGDGPVEGALGGADSGTWWRVLILAASPVLVVPVVFLAYLARGIPALVLRAGTMKLPPGEMGQISATLSRDAVAAVALGVLSIALSSGAGVGTVIAARSGTTQDRLTMFSWAVLAVVVAWGAWFVLQLSVDIRAFQSALR